MTETSVTAARYLRNPEVVLREEDEDGALLFNPDTNQVKILNSTGVFIWKQADGSRDLAEICKNLADNFDGAKLEEVTQDVIEFVQEMVDSGFLGSVK